MFLAAGGRGSGTARKGPIGPPKVPADCQSVGIWAFAAGFGPALIEKGCCMKVGKKEWATWAEWIERVKSDLQATVNDRAVFHGFGDVVRANEEWIRAHHGGYFCDLVARGYVARAAMGVRRHVKRDDDSVSLVQILSQMKDCAPQLTFDFYLQQFPRNDADGFFWQKPTFKLVSENGAVASGQIIASDVEGIHSPVEIVECDPAVEPFAVQVRELFVDERLHLHGQKLQLLDVAGDDLPGCIELDHSVMYAPSEDAARFGELEAAMGAETQRAVQFVKQP
jgi:hypothetical protein